VFCRKNHENVFKAMSTEELYQEIIMDHAGKPRNFVEMAEPDAKVEAENPMCGDELTLFLRASADGLRIEKTQFTGQACAICTASASLLTTKIKSLPIGEAESLSQAFQEMLKIPAEESAEGSAERLGNLQVLEGVRKFPMRMKCATLAWHALDHAVVQLREKGHSEKLIFSDG